MASSSSATSVAVPAPRPLEHPAGGTAGDVHQRMSQRVDSQLVRTTSSASNKVVRVLAPTPVPAGASIVIGPRSLSRSLQASDQLAALRSSGPALGPTIPRPWNCSEGCLGRAVKFASVTDTLSPPDLNVDYSATASEAYRAALEVIGAVEPRIADAIGAELADQRESLKLIASENYASPAVLLAMGNWLSDKYAEGTIGHRFYAGCQNVDTVEALAAEHARELFGAPHAYVQPHSGIDANLVAFWAILAAPGRGARRWPRPGAAASTT